MILHKRIALLLVSLLAAGALAGCAGDNGESGERQTFQQAGSSTVLPIAQAWAEEFPGEARFTVSGGGSGAGFKQFCRGEIDIADASRPIRESEVEACRAAGIEPFEVPVATDALAVVVSEQNEFVTDLTTEELYRIYASDPEQQVNRWNELRAEWPDEPIERYGPGTDSGTFDYFVEAIIHPHEGDESKGRADYTKSEDDNVLVQGVSASPYAIGYFGLAYVAENEGRVRAVPIDSGEGPVAPTPENVESGAYEPLARPIFMYTDGNPEGVLEEYFVWGLGEEGQALVEEVGYIALPAAKRAEVLAAIQG